MHLQSGLSIEQASEICINKCGAQCCKSSNLLSLYPEEAKLLEKKAEEFGRSIALRQDEEGNYYLRIAEQANAQCPMLGSDNRCQIYDTRPICCQRYPHRKIAGCYISGGGYKFQLGAAFVGIVHGPVVPGANLFKILKIVESGHTNQMMNGFLTEDFSKADSSRNHLCESFLKKTDAQFLVMLNADVQYPESIVQLLTRSNLPVVGGVHYQKGESDPQVYKDPGYGGKASFQPMKREVDEWRLRLTPDFTPEVGHLKKPGDNLLLCDHVSIDCISIRRDVLEKIPSPWFENTGDVAEDVNFERRVRQAGYQIYADLSIVCGERKLSR